MIGPIDSQTRPAAPRGTTRPVGRVLTVSAICLLLASLSGCSTDDDIGGILGSCLVFEPDSDPPVSEKVTSQLDDSSDCDLARVNLVASGLTSVWDASFEVHYPSGIVAIPGCGPGQSFLLEGASNLLFECRQVVPGVLEVGISRDGSENVAGVDSGTDGLLLTFTVLRQANSGSGEVTLEDTSVTQVVIAGDQPVPHDPAVVFTGGTLTITPL